MKNLDASRRALHVIDTATDLFKQYGFNKVGVDQIIADSQINKGTFYSYFHSKERFIERCLVAQKEQLQEKVSVVSELYQNADLSDQLRQIYLLHADSEGFYRLPFKAIFEIEKHYPSAYKVVVDYRNWLIQEIHKLLLTVKPAATVEDAHMFLFVVDGAMVQFLGSNQTDEREYLIDYFLSRV